MALSNVTLVQQAVFPLVFVQDNVAASQSAVALNIQEVASAAALLCTSYVAPTAGDLLGISWLLSAAGTAGVFTISITLDGTVVSGTTQTVGTATSGYATFTTASGIHFTAGQKIGVKIATDGSWDGTTADLVVYPLVMLNLADV